MQGFFYSYCIYIYVAFKNYAFMLLSLHYILVDDSPPPLPEVRLVSENDDDFQGRVEIKVYGVWGTICSDLWDFNDGDVVCR